MGWHKDLKSKPKKNRFFPLRFGDAVRAVKDLNLLQYDESRIAIKMENTEGEFNYGFPLFDLVPEEDLVLFSLDESFNLDVSKKATLLALSKLSKLKIKPKDHIHSSYFCAYISLKNEVILTRVDMTSKLKKYRGDDKLSNARYVGSSHKEIELDKIHI
jgi:hypothetical protein